MVARFRSGALPQVYNLFKAIIISNVILIPLFCSNSFAKDEEMQGLDLQETTSKMEVESILYENPHLRLKCEDCHEHGVDKFTRHSEAKLKYKDSVKLCNSCHEGANLHPVGINPSTVNPKMKPPAFLKLGDKGEYKDKIICTTCHDVHAKETDNNLLRGFRGSSSGVTQFKQHQEFCVSCHKTNLAKRSPHDGDKDACVFCHVSDPTSAEKPETTVRLDIIRRCNFCHMKLEGAHFLAVNAFADKALQADIPALKLPFIRGKITCVTCHDQHFDSKIPHRLRPEFVAFAEKSVRINPHWKGTFCLACHDKVPQKGEKPTFLFNGDIIQVCNRCHLTEEATADIHPVGMVVEKSDTISVPKEFPLENGVLTCNSCHDLRTQTSINEKARRINPKFLRGGPYESRNDICFKCHTQESYEQQSPHEQLDKDGKIIEAKCLFCHSSRPDVKIIGIRPKMFKGDVSTFCYGCHAGKEERHPVNVTHQGRNPSKARLDCIKKTEEEQHMKFPLYEGTLFCGTCHNPHQRGVLEGAAQAGAGKTNKLRMPGGYEMCVVCHCDKGSLR